jgi:hypothetical protein
MSPDRTSGDTEIVGSHLIRHVLPIREIHNSPLTNAQSLDRTMDVGTELRKMNQYLTARPDLPVPPPSITAIQVASFIGDRLMEVSAPILDLTPPRATERSQHRRRHNILCMDRANRNRRKANQRDSMVGVDLRIRTFLRVDRHTPSGIS